MAGIDSDLIRGHIDTIILKSLYTGDKYGLEIIQEIEQKSNGSYELKQPTLYSCLKRLENQGLISSYWEDSEIGGKRHYYTLTDLGKETYQSNQEEWMRSKEIIDNLIYNTTLGSATVEDVEESTSEDQTPIIDQEITEIEAKNDEVSSDFESADYLANDDQIDEFASFEEVENTAFNTFFEANSEVANDSEFADDDELSIKTVDETAPEITNEEQSSTPVETEVVSLDILEEPDTLVVSNIDEDSESNTSSIDNNSHSYLSFVDMLSDQTSIANTSEVKDDNENNSNDQIDEFASNELIEKFDIENSENLVIEDTNLDCDSVNLTEELDYNSNETLLSDDDEIYSPEPEIPEDEQIYVPEDDGDVSVEDIVVNNEIYEKLEEKSITSPTYINFDNTSYDEVDITNQDFADNEDEKSDFAESYFLDIEEDDDQPEDNTDISLEETETSIDTPPLYRASQEEIESLYRTTENYENLQAGYTDETYKQMLNELESYGSSTEPSKQSNNHIVKSYTQLSEDLDNEGIIIRKYEKQIKETSDTKIYIKTNKIHMVKNWITFGITAFAILLTFFIMNAFKESFTYNFEFWQFAAAAGAALLLPLFSSIKYAINPYKKVVAKYAPRLNILLSALITIQLIMIIYCVNLQLGFYSFSQENYNHLLWILPLILSFIPFIQSLIYYPLYNSKNYHT